MADIEVKQIENANRREIFNRGEIHKMKYLISLSEKPRVLVILLQQVTMVTPLAPLDISLQVFWSRFGWQTAWLVHVNPTSLIFLVVEAKE